MIEFFFEFELTILTLDGNFSILCRCWAFVNDVNERLFLLKLTCLCSFIEHTDNAFFKIRCAAWVVQINHLNIWMLIRGFWGRDHADLLEILTVHTIAAFIFIVANVNVDEDKPIVRGFFLPRWNTTPVAVVESERGRGRGNCFSAVIINPIDKISWQENLSRLERGH